MSDDTTHPLPVEWKQTDEYRRMVVALEQKRYIAQLERERCHTADDEGRAA